VPGDKSKDKKRLQTQVEQELVTPLGKPMEDSVDPDLLAHINTFLVSLPDAVKLEEFSLRTQEEAQHALLAINHTMRRLEQQLTIARALKHSAMSWRDEE